MSLIGHGGVYVGRRQGTAGRDGSGRISTSFFMQVGNSKRILQGVVGELANYFREVNFEIV